jgi:hypothetical protein
MLGFYTNFANTLEKMEKDRLKYTNKVNCEGEIKKSILSQGSYFGAVAIQLPRQLRASSGGGSSKCNGDG